MPLLFKQTSSHYLSIPYNSAFAPVGAITLMAWVKPSSAVSGAIIQRVQTASTGNNIWSLELAATATLLVPKFTLGTTTIGLLTRTYGMDTCSPTTATLPLGTWSHVCATWNGATMTVYTNGVAVATTARTAAIGTSTSLVAIGAAYHSSGSIDTYLDGGLEDLRVFNRSLSPAEIATIVFCNGRDGIRNGLVTNFRFTGSAGTSVSAGTNIQDLTPNRFRAAVVAGGQSFDAPILANRIAV